MCFMNSSRERGGGGWKKQKNCHREFFKMEDFFFVVQICRTCVVVIKFVRFPFNWNYKNF